MERGRYPNSGALFRNERKEKETHADYRGSAEIDGVEYWLDAWIKQGQKGSFMSLSFKRKEARRGPEPVARDLREDPLQRVRQGVQRHFGGRDLDDEIPF